MCIYIHICMRTCTHTYIYIYTYVYIHIRMYEPTNIKMHMNNYICLLETWCVAIEAPSYYTYIYIHMYMYIYIYVHIHMYILMFLYLYIYIYMYTYTLCIYAYIHIWYLSSGIRYMVDSTWPPAMCSSHDGVAAPSRLYVRVVARCWCLALVSTEPRPKKGSRAQKATYT